MRITKDLLHKYAIETVKQRQRSEPDLHAVYLTGSVLSDNPMLGGTTDIDMVFVHKYQAPVQREVVPLTREVSLDIVHTVQDDYAKHRELRKDPNLGYPLTHYNINLYDTDHWLEFIQSCTNADFQRPDFVLTRVKFFFDQARENWLALNTKSFENHLAWLDFFLASLEAAANAVAGLTGAPLTTRRFMLTLQDRLERLGTPHLMEIFLQLLGFVNIQDEKILAWLTDFENDYDVVLTTGNLPIHLGASRRAYYVDAIRALAESGDPSQAAWPLIRTWLDVHLAAGKSRTKRDAWDRCLDTLGLIQENHTEKTDTFDVYLDQIEIVLEAWANAYGI